MTDLGDDARLPARTAALVGVLALAAALAAGHLVAAFVGAGASPVVAVGATAIDLTPAWLKDFAVSAFGTYDKLVLLLGMAVVLLLAAIGAGLLSRRSPTPGLVVITVLGALAVAAVFTRPDLGQLAALAPLASLVAGALTFRALHRRAQPATDPGTLEPTDRRGFLIGAGGVAAGAGLAGLAGQWIGGGRDAAGSRAAVGDLAVADPAPAIPPGADFADLGTPTFLTPNDRFYRIDTALVVPRVRAEDWTLRISGMVDRELTLDYAAIRARPLVERTITMACVSNDVGGPYVSTANFLGVPLADLLREAGVRPGAEQLLSTSEDGWTCGTPVDAVLDPARGALLAIGMNGEPLPLEHGFPARMVVPGLYGYVSATKWVRDIEVTTWAARDAYWLSRGWAERAPVKTQSRIDTPDGSATLPAGRVTVAGVAWAPTIGITGVEIRLDRHSHEPGPWQPAELAAAVHENTWRMWRAELDVPPGRHRVACRAVDATGYTQTGERSSPAPDGATGWHTVTFTTE
ncbi:DMSO/TMAO reductase YedYZ, molybdopterin-dependent catalytic subunit [Amycolatopsis arida]|uniref:DMSO/TMAO reductase YedYZ, molybdopterin-dependent catalytic subunit n=1 Tax=Amycolatopsis arida TaxID=587909 RepID=A0A1I5Y8U3_9PSEU|nr:molybdopterin-dependent oxidoreductase [Amycolatopsis arida]TDX90363.1 DMSO/TMAO reductase YedYZ molybdopterin-dependent catalytic subunit [Amycolatopsis arida]SFQ40604.1 DMSO/TMAO reductase YedYZ, molybdopterin-dependent catalytic subunit [Amycolatopsis arida]